MLGSIINLVKRVNLGETAQYLTLYALQIYKLAVGDI